uniref:beta-eliminating lyase-related protein n=1 Tax=Aquabacterium sp. TaxID=1872578 RepID=UPI003784AEDC
RLHMDGARLWESAPFYARPHAEICAGFDSVYVSVYKGIGALSGALLAGDAEFVAQARLWRRRMGGTLYHLSPMIASAAMRFDERVALMPALYQRAQQLAAALQPFHATMRVNPGVPHTPLFHLFFAAPADAVAEARDTLAQQHGAWLVDGIEPAEVPGWSRTELTLGDRVLAVPHEQLVPLFEQFHALLQNS